MSVEIERAESGVAVVTLNRPDKLNALDEEMAVGLESALMQLTSDKAVGCIVIRGAGGHFMAGGDIDEFYKLLDLNGVQRQDGIRKVLLPVHRCIRNIRGAGTPVLASVSGACAGFGLSLITACDLVIASKQTTFSLAYRNIGASPDGGSTYSLPRIVGLKNAMELALLGERFSSEDALRIGLVNRVVEGVDLDNASAQMALAIASGPRATLARTKRLINASLESTLDQQLQAEEQSFLQGAIESEFETGVRAFKAKQKPKFN
jgi:2-(1,2-epoxy-1,2-dihydrophenyl)acetyl-CoA isomerase